MTGVGQKRPFPVKLAVRVSPANLLELDYGNLWQIGMMKRLRQIQRDGLIRRRWRNIERYREPVNLTNVT